MITIFVAAWSVDARLQDMLGRLSELHGAARLPPFEAVVALDLPQLRGEMALAALGPFPFPVRPFSAPRRKGEGAALKAALQTLETERIFYIPTVTEATGSLLYQCLLHHDDADVVLGYPINLEARHTIRNVGTFLFRMLYLVTFGIVLNCVNSPGIYPAASLRSLALRGDRFSFLSELNIRILRSGCRYCEIPYYTYTDRRLWRGLSFFDLVDLAGSYFSVIKALGLSESAKMAADTDRRHQLAPKRFSTESQDAAGTPTQDSGKVTFVVPALNEEQNIGPTIDMIQGVCRDYPSIPYEIVVVDDGSKDGTASVVEHRAQLQPDIVRLMQHERNLGIGAALKSGIKASKGERFFYVPGDNQASPLLVSLALQFDGAADIVFVYPANLGTRGTLRNLLSQIYIMVFMVACKSCLNYVNATALYPVRFVKDMNLRGSGFSFFAELNVKLIRSGYSFIEIPGHANPEAEANRRIWRAVNPRNILETIAGLVKLVWELSVTRRSSFNHRPVRLLVDLSDRRRAPPKTQEARLQTLVIPNDVIALTNYTAHNGATASLTDSGLKITTPAAPWHYAVSLPVSVDHAVKPRWPAVFHLDIESLQGRASIVALHKDFTTPIDQAIVSSESGRRRIDLYVPRIDACAAIMVRAADEPASAEILIHDMQLQCSPFEELFALDRTLFAFYDLNSNPLSFDFAYFLMDAEFERRRQRLERLYLVVIPSGLGARTVDSEYDAIINESARIWRRHNIIGALAELLPSIVGYTFAASREEGLAWVSLAQHCHPQREQIRSRSLADFHRTVCGGAIQQFRPGFGLVGGEYARHKVRQWLDANTAGRHPVTITLRQYSHLPQRNSNLATWAEFARRISADGFAPVFVLDTEVAMEGLAPQLTGLGCVFPEASWNLGLRMALYELAYVNMLTNTGPAVLCFLSERARYIYCKILVPGLAEASTELFLDCGLQSYTQPPFTGPFQRWLWEDDAIEPVYEAFQALIKDLEPANV